jgi:hypothetical protein
MTVFLNRIDFNLLGQYTILFVFILKDVFKYNF